MTTDIADTDAGYYWRCFACGCLLALSAEAAVIIEAEQCVGIDCHLVFCPRCAARRAALSGP